MAERDDKDRPWTVEDVDDLEQRLERLRSLYEMYFQGIEKFEPVQARKTVFRLVLKANPMAIANTGLRFRLRNLIQRYNVYQSYWNRMVSQIESGTFKRDRTRYQRRLEERATDVPREQRGGVRARRLRRMLAQRGELPREDEAPAAPEEQGRAAQAGQEVAAAGKAAPGVAAAGAAVPRAVVSQMPPAAPPAPPVPAPAASAAAVPPAPPVPAPAAPTAAVPPAPPVPAPAASPAAASRAAAPVSPGPQPPQRPSQPVPARPPGAAPRRESQYQEIYAELLRRREECRQSTAGMSFEAIAQRLDASRASLIASGGCRDVTFHVVVEDGKAKLKAVPVPKG